MLNKVIICFLLGTTGTFHAQEMYHPSVPKPTESEVQYGDHERHVLDFWQAKSDEPTPLVFVIHGGGWRQNSKESLHKFVDANALLENGISVVAINYRLMKHSEGIEPPVKAPLSDAARALQFVRSKAKQWNIDKERIGAAGASAGACSSLWLAFHNDMAEPDSKHPVARESTRLFCAAVTIAQTTLDPKQMREWIPNIKYGGHAFGYENFDEFLQNRDEILEWIKDYSPYYHVSKDDPPVYLKYGQAPSIGEKQKNATHSSNFGLKLQERCQAVGVECRLVYKAAPHVNFKEPTDYLIATLKGRTVQIGN